MEALKLHSRSEEPMTKDKDGDDGSVLIGSVVIEKVVNGYIVVWFDETGEEIKEVYNDRDDLLGQLNIYI